MERLLKDIRSLLVMAVLLLSVIGGCQISLMLKVTKASRAEAKSEEITKVDLVKVGGYYVSKWEFLGEKK